MHDSKPWTLRGSRRRDEPTEWGMLEAIETALNPADEIRNRKRRWPSSNIQAWISALSRISTFGSLISWSVFFIPRRTGRNQRKSRITLTLILHWVIPSITIATPKKFHLASDRPCLASALLVALLYPRRTSRHGSLWVLLCNAPDNNPLCLPEKFQEICFIFDPCETFLLDNDGRYFIFTFDSLRSKGAG